MGDFLSNITLVVTEIMDWVVTVCETIIGQPILLFTVGFLAIGGAVGIFGRLLSRS